MSEDANILEPLFDIEGVYGAFVLDTVGGLVCTRVPFALNLEGLQSAGKRIARLWSALPEGESPSAQVLRFHAHSLYVGHWSGGSVCTLAGTDVNRYALEIAVRVVVLALEACHTAPAPDPQNRKSRTHVYRGVRYNVE